MISAEKLTKSFAGHTLFDDISFKVNARERVGLVGRNGHGKTTLFKLIVGEETPDSGSLRIPKLYRIGYVRQEIAFTHETILAEGMQALPPTEKNHHWKVEKILAGLGFSATDMTRHPMEFSGGYQIRLNLAKTLVSEPDLLLLDEPTNYLDITSIRWVEAFLNNWPHELLLITHDRSFMDKVVTHVLGIHRKKIRKISGSTDDYYTQLAQDEEIYEKTRLNDERRRKEITQFITRFRAKARLANLVQSRIKTLAKMEKKNHLERIKTLDFAFCSKPFEARDVLHARDLTFGYDDSPILIRNFNLTVRAGDRICIVGRNGAGKTTLIKLLAGALQPRAGAVKYHRAVSKGFFEQTNISSLNRQRTVVEEILFAHPAVDQQKARSISGAMMFSGDDALKKIGVLSGGEKSRVMLGKLLVTPVNLLLLDEPTNHLDMDSCDALLAAIDSFDGAVIMVTHNEMFLHALANRLIIFQDQQVEVFDGTYGYFLEKWGWQNETFRPLPVAQANRPAPSIPKTSRKKMRQKRSEIIADRSRTLRPLEKQIAQLENEIDAHETELAILNNDMVSASQSQDGCRIKDISLAIRSCELKIEQRFEQLETLSETYEKKRSEYDQKLEQLEGGVLPGSAVNKNGKNVTMP